MIEASGVTGIFNPIARQAQLVLEVGSRHPFHPLGARHAGGSNGSAKYCVSRTTFPAWNSMMLTVSKRRAHR